MRTQAPCEKCLNVERSHMKSLELSTVLLLAHSSNHRCKSVEHNSAMTWQKVHQHTVVDAFCSRKSLSALLVHEEHASQKRYLSSCHSTACGEYNRNIYENTRSMRKTSKH